MAHQVGNDPIRQATVSPELQAHGENVPLIRAAFPGAPGGMVGQLPVLRLSVQELSPRLGAPVKPPAFEGRPPQGRVSPVNLVGPGIRPSSDH